MEKDLFTEALSKNKLYKVKVFYSDLSVRDAIGDAIFYEISDGIEDNIEFKPEYDYSKKVVWKIPCFAQRKAYWVKAYLRPEDSDEFIARIKQQMRDAINGNVFGLKVYKFCKECEEYSNVEDTFLPIVGTNDLNNENFKNLLSSNFGIDTAF